MKKITSLREVKKTLKRTSPTSAVKLPDFSAELWQLLTSNLGARRVANFCPCSPLGERTRGVYCRLVFEIVCSGSQNVVASAILSGEDAFAREL